MIWLSFWTELWVAVQEKISFPAIPSKAFSTSLITASLVLAALVGVLFYENHSTITSLTQHGIVGSGRILTEDTRVVKIICKPGLQPPLCLAGEYGKDNGLAVQ